MGMLERSERQKITVKTIGVVTALAVFVYLVMIISATSKLSGAAGPVVYDGKIGPLHLFELSKISAGGNTTASAAISSGIFFYLAIWLLIGVLIIWWRLARNKQIPAKSQSKE